ncbi:DUF1641 domain-containing protein [Alicyclobacillus acidocaldarius]|uniref:DUF1641 domain-containing protein n=1 Tax=Alicyclobacillus acidocaldarius TaxID=405212 RepID=UPI00345E50F8
MSETQQMQETLDVSDILLDPSVQRSLNNVLERLPQIAKLVEALTADERTLESLTAIVEHLPQLAKLVYLVSRVSQAVEDVITDGDSLEGFGKLAKQMVEPAVGPAKKLIDAYKVAKERAEHDTTTYSVFSLLKLLKEPVVQKNLRIVSAMLEELGKDESHGHH